MAEIQKDEKGQGWYYYPSGARIRAKEGECEHCGEAYLSRGPQRFCSSKCAALHRGGGANSNNWKGGRVQRPDGYVAVYAPDHPNAMKNNKVLEHRLVMEKQIGRYLESYEIVHHKNGDRADNRIENPELWVKGHPWGQRVEDAPHCATCTCRG